MTVTPDQYIETMIVRFPSLFAGKGSTYDNSGMRILDDLVGGHRDDESLLAVLNFSPTKEYDHKYHTNKVWYGFKEVEELEFKDGKPLKFPIGDSVDVLECDKENHPEVVYWLDAGEYIPYEPYPHFDEMFSIMYRCPAVLTLSRDWLRALLFFHTECQQWFIDHESKYHYAFPLETQEKTDRHIEDMEQRFKDYKSDEAFSKDYECEYKGDMHDFEVRRWAIGKAKIDKFLVKTVKLIEDKLAEGQGSMVQGWSDGEFMDMIGDSMERPDLD